MVNVTNTHEQFDRISQKAQRNVKFLVLSILGSSIAISTVSASSFIQPPVFSSQNIFDSFIFLFLVGIIAQITLQVTHFEDIWFQARAIAETVKSLEWQYSMATGPLEDSSKADQIFLEEVRNARSGYSARGRNKQSKDSPRGNDISSEMQSLRALPWEAKRSIYDEQRIEDQIKWYRKKATNDKRLSLIYSSFATAIQTAGIAIAIYGYVEAVIRSEAVLGLIATIVSSMVAWTQSRKYAELVEPYSYTARLLEELKKELQTVSTEPYFKEIVETTERSISREHQMWQVRRGVGLSRHLAGGHFRDTR